MTPFELLPIRDLCGAFAAQDAMLLMSAAPPVEAQEPEDSPRISLIVVGEAGRALLNTSAWQRVRLANTIAVHTDAGALAQMPADARHLLNYASALQLSPNSGKVVLLVLGPGNATDLAFAAQYFPIQV